MANESGDPVINEDKRIVTGNIINNMPVIPQNWFKSNLNKCLQRSEIKTSHDESLDVDYYLVGYGNEPTPPSTSSLVPKKCVEIYYKEFSTSYDNLSFLIELSNIGSSSVYVSYFEVRALCYEFSTDTNKFSNQKALGSLIYSPFTLSGGSTILSPNQAPNNSEFVNKIWKFKSLYQRLTFDITMSLQGTVNQALLYAYSFSQNWTICEFNSEWVGGFTNKTFGKNVVSNSTTPGNPEYSDFPDMKGEAINFNPGTTKIKLQIKNT